MNVYGLLADLKEQGVEVRVENGELKLVGRRSVLANDLLAKLRQHKDELLAALSQRPALVAGQRPETLSRVAVMRQQIPAHTAIPFLVVVDVPPSSPSELDRCASCGDPLPRGARYRCAACQEAAWQVLNEARGCARYEACERVCGGGRMKKRSQ